MKCLILLIIAFTIYFPSVSEAAPVSYDCGKLSTMIVTHPNASNDHLQINGVDTSAVGPVFLSFPCSGIVTVDCTDGQDYEVALIPFENPYQVTDFSMIVSFLIGALSAIAFVIAVDTAWKGGSV